MAKTLKKIFKHGGSYAVDLPINFIKHMECKEVILEYSPKKVSISPKTELDNIESEPMFSSFINALAADAMKCPEKLRDVKEVWDKEWDELLKDVSVNGE